MAALRSLARVNLAAIERNIARLRRELAGGTELCAVVKADGYGHGAVPVARAALNAGATRLAVVTGPEAAALRTAGIDAPILIMGALSAEEIPAALDADAELVAWDERFVDELVRAGRRRHPGAAGPISVHVKLDTGMGRLGTRSLSEGLAVADKIAALAPAVALRGAMTHFATADDDPEFATVQLQRFQPFVAAVRARNPGIVAHAANSAGTLNVPGSHFDFVRCGIAIYGGDPMNEDPTLRGLEPALELVSYVAAVKAAEPGDSAGYGRRFIALEATTIGTLPIGYADGIRRALSGRGAALVGGRRHPIVGAVSMDNITIDLGPAVVGPAVVGRPAVVGPAVVGRPAVVGPARAIAAGDPATIIGVQGPERQTAEQLARAIDTINYEIFCGISSRVPRAYHRDGEPVG